jgi:hypothetical protein
MFVSRCTMSVFTHIFVPCDYFHIDPKRGQFNIIIKSARGRLRLSSLTLYGFLHIIIIVIIMNPCVSCIFFVKMKMKMKMKMEMKKEKY